MRRILFLTLTTFSKTGGIEKFNRSLSKALSEFAAAGKINAVISSVYDNKPNREYTGQCSFNGYKGKRWLFIIGEWWNSRTKDEIIIGHLNLAVLLVLIKTFFPSKKIILILHGIEILEPLSGIKRKAINLCDEIWAVSEFTRQNIIRLQQQPAEKVKIFYNTIDPYFRLPQNFDKPDYLRQRYLLQPGEKVILTVTRLNHTENYKGYDKVITALPAVKKVIPQIKYIIVGDGDDKEIDKLNRQMKELGLEREVVLTGYVPDNELTDYFLLSDVFVMPSSKEGFGIVFIEALACGLNVIGGNKDGTVDALSNGEMGTLVDPGNVEEIAGAIIDSLKKESISSYENHKRVQEEIMGKFGFEKYKNRLGNFLGLDEYKN